MPKPISVLVAAAAAFLAPLVSASAATLADTEPYIRVQPDEPTGGVALQIAVRTFERGPAEPAITLVGVAHVGDAAYYAALQDALDAHELVLYEGVAPMWTHPTDGLPDRDRAAITEARLRVLRVAVERSLRNGGTPDTLDALIDEKAGYDTPMLRSAFRDGWDRPMRFALTDDGPRITSLGADGEPGGRGYDADLSAADLPATDPLELDEPDGIQAQLARAARVVFQLDAINYDRDTWRNSDTTAEALGVAMAGGDPEDAHPGGGGPAVGGDGNALFDLMSGQGMIGKLAGGLLKMIGSSPQSSAMLRLMLIETLGQADDLMGATQGIEGLDGMMEALLVQRNAVVLEDLEAAIEERKQADNPGRIAVFYGAAHLPEMEAELVELGFRPTNTEWFDALEVDPGQTGMSRQQITALRGMIGRMMESQIRMLEQADE